MCAEPHSGKVRSADPRPLRSKRVLMDALARLMQTQDFEAISIQDLAAAAGMNRASFYLHYPSKHALLQAMTAARFSELMARRGLVPTQCDEALKAIALGVCDYLVETRCPEQLSQVPLESAVAEVIQNRIREGASGCPSVAAPVWASSVAWAILGAARQWYLTPEREPAEAMAEKIQALVKPLLHVQVE